MWRDTPINLVAFHGHTEIVKFLAPLTDNPSAPDNFQRLQFIGQHVMAIPKLLNFWPL